MRASEAQTEKNNLVLTATLFVFPIVIIFTSLIVLTGWALGITALTRLNPSLAGMNPVTAVLFIFIAASFLIHQLNKVPKLLKILSGILTGLTFTISLARIIDYFTPLDLGVDLALFRVLVTDPSLPLDRMALASTISFFCLAVSFFLYILVKHRIQAWTGQILATIPFSLAILSILFHATRSINLIESELFSNMALHTAFLFLLLSACWFTYCYLDHRLFIYTKLNVLGLYFFTLSLVWLICFAPEFKELPSNFSFSASVYSLDNLYDTQNKTFTGSTPSNTHFTYKVLSKSESEMDLKAIYDVKKPNGETIISLERLYAIDPETIQHIPSAGDNSREGYLFAPRNLNKQDFTYWQINYNQPLTLSYVDETTIKGINVYHYHTQFTADQTTELGNIPEVGETKGINLDVKLSMWFEPKTGRLINYNEDAQAYYYDLATKERIEPWNYFQNKLTDSSVEDQVLATRQQLQVERITGLAIPAYVAFLGVICFLLYSIRTYTQIKQSLYLPFAVWLISIVLILSIWRAASVLITQQKQAHFENESEEMITLILTNLGIYAQALQGGNGLIVSSDAVSRQEFANYATTINLQNTHPGIQGFGYSIFIEPEDLEDHQEAVRGEGFPEYAVTPEGEREIYSSIIYIEPFDTRNQQAFGYDMFSEPIRKQAMEKARDEARINISGKVTLVQEIDQDVQSGFLMYVPVYKQGLPITSPEERRAAIQGYIFSPFRAGDLIRSALRNENHHINLKLYDGLEITEENKLFEFANAEYPPENKPRLTYHSTLDLYGREWTLVFESLPTYHTDNIANARPTAILIIGLAMSTILTFTTYFLSSSRSKAIDLAEDITEDLRVKTEELNKINQNLKLEISNREVAEQQLTTRTKELEKINKLMIDRELKMIELKKKVKE